MTGAHNHWYPRRAEPGEVGVEAGMPPPTCLCGPHLSGGLYNKYTKISSHGKGRHLLERNRGPGSESRPSHTSPATNPGRPLLFRQRQQPQVEPDSGPGQHLCLLLTP